MILEAIVKKISYQSYSLCEALVRQAERYLGQVQLTVKGSFNQMLPGFEEPILR